MIHTSINSCIHYPLSTIHYPLSTICIHHLFEEQAIRTPGAIAVIDENDSLTYQTLNSRANQLAHHLNRLGIGTDMPVGLCLESSLDLVVGLLGILKAGGGYVPLDLTYPLERITYMLIDSHCTVLLTQSQTVAKLPVRGLSVLCLDTEWPRIAEESQENPSQVSTPDSLAYVIYTSGSTGQPKGIEMPHRVLVNLIQWQVSTTTVSRTARTLQFTPISFDVSVQEIFTTLCSGGTLVMMPAAVRRDPKALLQTLIDQEIERLFLPPVALHQLAVVATDLEITPSPLREVITAGDQLQITPAIADFFQGLTHGTLHNHYGPSETHVVTAFTLNGSPSTWPKLPPIGQPISNSQVYLLDETLQQVPTGNCGELYIGGVALARGYMNRPELTAAKFIPNPYGPGRLYKSGDLARQLPDGNLEFLGRLDHQVKIRGFRIELGEIETLLSQHPMVNETVVVPHGDTAQNKRLVAYVVPKTVIDLKSTRGAHIEQVHTWQRIWDEAYQTTHPGADTFHLGGWNDSYTGASLPEVQVREWVTKTVERVMALAPRRVLEIGCGTGLLLFPIAPQCTHYHGTDISAEGLKYIQQQIRSTPLEKIVTLQQMAADALSELQIAPVDTILINGVIQFFPGMDYFLEVLETALPLVQPGGQIFIGDVQSYTLMELFHTSVQLYQAPAKLSTADLWRRVQERLAEEKKLLFSPTFFATLPYRFPQISHLEIQLKRGQSQNELTRFRYDVVLHVGKSVTLPAQAPVWSTWQTDSFTWSKVRQQLTELAPEFLGIAQVPNARLWTDLQALTLLTSPQAPNTVGELKKELQPGGIEPEAWWELATELPYRVHLCWSAEGNPAGYDVLLQRQDSATTVTTALFPAMPVVSTEIEPGSVYTNNPLQSKEALGPKLRHFLKQKLPDYMIPATFIVLEELPLTPSGKLNRRLLPVPKSERPVSEQPFVAPQTATEEKLAEIWAEMLNIQPIGRDDNFFDLGGHSLLIMQLLSQVRETFQVDLPLASLFENPTLAQWAQVIKAHHQDNQTTTLTAMTVSELQPYVKLDSTIGWSDPSVVPVVTSPQRVFLTGVTGFLGAFLLDELLRQTAAEVYCLVRGCKTLTKAKQRIYQNLQRYGLTDFVRDETLNPRIIPVRGDLSQPWLGLTESEFEILAQEVEIIYHLGAEVNLLYPYIAMQATNVQGTQEILRLASHLKLKPVHYTSTIGIFESAAYVGHPALPEQLNLEAGDLIYGGYAQSKWVAEQMLSLAHSRGIPITIYRLGAATGHSQTGVTDTDHILIALLRYCLQQRSVPKLDMPVDMTPVDYICQAMVHLSQQTSSWGKVFHLVNPQPLSYIQLTHALTELGYSLELEDYSQWLSTLRRMNIDSPDNLFGALLPMFTGNLPNTHLTYLEMSSIGMRFDCRNTTAGLTHSAIRCPPPDTRLLKTYLAYLQSRHQTLPQRN